MRLHIFKVLGHSLGRFVDRKSLLKLLDQMNTIDNLIVIGDYWSDVR